MSPTQMLKTTDLRPVSSYTIVGCRFGMQLSCLPPMLSSDYLRVLAEVLPLDAGFLQVGLPVPHVHSALHRQQCCAISSGWDD